MIYPIRYTIYRIIRDISGPVREVETISGETMSEVLTDSITLRITAKSTLLGMMMVTGIEVKALVVTEDTNPHSHDMTTSNQGVTPHIGLNMANTKNITNAVGVVGEVIKTGEVTQTKHP